MTPFCFQLFPKNKNTHHDLLLFVVGRTTPDEGAPQCALTVPEGRYRGMSDSASYAP